MGEACRNYIVSLYYAGVDTQAQLIPNLSSRENLGKAHDICRELVKNYVDYKIKIIHTTPDSVTNILEPMKYHIFHLFWETDHLPDWWVWALNLMDEVWTGSEWNKKIFIDSGVKKPIYVIPQAVDTTMKNDDPFPAYNGRSLYNKHNFYNFYSIFQWIERKNPKALLKAYWKEFEGVEDVCLLLKTYKESFTHTETEKIITDIRKWKSELNLSHYPKVFLYPGLMSKHDIWRLHATGDCYVSAHRGEGWGIPIVEAMVSGKPIISTNLGGVHEHIDRGCGHLIPYKLVNVFGMNEIPWYEKDQLWAEIDSKELRKSMRFMYENREKGVEIGKKAKKMALEKFSYKNIGQQMKKRLDEINILYH